MYTSGGEYFRALQALKRAISGYFCDGCRTSLPSPYWQGLFPRPYWDALRRYSEENGLDPYLVASLIRQESEFNPSAVSHANAYGLMQLLPTTGKGEAKQTGTVSATTQIRCSIPTPTLSWARTISARWWTTSAAKWSTRSRLTTRVPIACEDWRAVGELSRHRGVRRVDSVHRDSRIRAGHRAQRRGLQEGVRNAVEFCRHTASSFLASKSRLTPSPTGCRMPRYLAA